MSEIKAPKKLEINELSLKNKYAKKNNINALIYNVLFIFEVKKYNNIRSGIRILPSKKSRMGNDFKFTNVKIKTTTK